ncbi:MAG: hypothetical protein EOP33_08120, partial [Rickettsiaceae bacterium]
RGDIRLKSEDKHVCVLGEVLVALAPNEPSYVIYLNSLNNWEVPPNITLTETEKQDVVSAIRKHFEVNNFDEKVWKSDLGFLTDKKSEFDSCQCDNKQHF